MKKILIVLLGIVIIMTFSACSENTNQPSESENITPESVNFDCSAKVPAKASNTEPGGYGISDLLRIFNNSEEVADYSEIAIKGKVEKTQYVLDICNVYTKSTVVIEEVYKGDLKVGDEIFVIETGGFIPKGVLSNAITMYKYGNEADDKDDPTILDIRYDDNKVMEEGEQVVLFLNKITRPDAQEFKVGCYEGCASWQSKLLYHEEINAYAPYIPEENKNDVEAKIYRENQLSSIVKDSAVKAS